MKRAGVMGAGVTGDEWERVARSRAGVRAAGGCAVAVATAPVESITGPTAIPNTWTLRSARCRVPEKTPQTHDWALPDPLSFSDIGLAPSLTRIGVARNFAAFPLPAAMNRKHRLELEDIMAQACAELAQAEMPGGVPFGGRYYSLTPGRHDFMREQDYLGLVKQVGTESGREVTMVGQGRHKGKETQDGVCLVAMGVVLPGAVQAGGCGGRGWAGIPGRGKKRQMNGWAERSQGKREVTRAGLPELVKQVGAGGEAGQQRWQVREVGV